MFFESDQGTFAWNGRVHRNAKLD